MPKKPPVQPKSAVDLLAHAMSVHASNVSVLVGEAHSLFQKEGRLLDLLTKRLEQLNNNYVQTSHREALFGERMAELVDRQGSAQMLFEERQKQIDARFELMNTVIEKALLIVTAPHAAPPVESPVALVDKKKRKGRP